MKKCGACGIMKPLSDFWRDKRRSDGRRSKCGPCATIENRESYRRNRAARIQSTKAWRHKNQGKSNAYMTLRRQRIKRQVVDGYGGSCTCCGEREIAFLGIEHKNGGGRKHRQERGGLGVYLDAINAGFPDQFTILCMNCNHATRNGKMCPHKQFAKEAI